MEAQEAEQLSLENQRRRALGLEPLDEWIDARESAEASSAEDAPESDDASAEDDEPVDRAQVVEAAEILLDYAHLQDAA